MASEGHLRVDFLLQLATQFLRRWMLFKQQYG